MHPNTKRYVFAWVIELNLVLALVCLSIRPKEPDYGAPRSSEWPKVRADHLAKHPACEVCGAKDNLEVHHYEPFHLHPEKELDPDNLVTLCGHGSRWNHHLWWGHLGDYECENKDLRAWIKAVKERKRE